MTTMQQEPMTPEEIERISRSRSAGTRTRGVRRSLRKGTASRIKPWITSRSL